MTKGYTLIEMIFVLFTISVMTLVLHNPSLNQLKLNLNMKKVYSFLVLKKRESQIYKDKIYINIHGNKITADDDVLVLDEGINCDHYSLVFNQRGNVNMGGSFICTYNQYTSKIVINLGNGNVYVQK